MLATQKGRSKPVRISSNRWRKLIFFSAWKRSDCNGPKKRSKEVKKTESLPSLDVVRQGGSKIGIPHPGGFLQRVQKLLKEKGLRFSCVQKSAQEVERNGER